MENMKVSGLISLEKSKKSYISFFLQIRSFKILIKFIFLGIQMNDK